MRPYPTYKPSGIDWLGDIPSHWDVRRLKQVAFLNPGRTETRATLTDSTPVVFLPMENVGTDGCINESEIRAAHEVWNGFTYFRRGDVLVAKITPCFENGKGAYLGTLRTDVGFGSTELHVLRANGVANPQFLYRLTTTHEFRRQGADAMTGAAGQKRVPASFISNFAIPVPPLDEQAAIVRYLDYVDRRIRRYVATKRKLIELLEEEKQAVISRAVTRGLDPNVRLKPSGVAWLGDVPEHWEVRRLKTICGMKSGEGITAESIEAVGEYPVYGGNGLRGYASSYTHDGAFALIGRQGALCGNVHIARGQFWASEHAVVAALDGGHEIGWFGAILTAMNLNQYSIAAAQPGLAVERILNLHLPVPPPWEQEEIVSHLGDTASSIDAGIARTRRQVELVQEYRTRLIADVVTGKLDVREAAAQLPEEPDDQDPIGENDPLTDGLPGDLYDIDESVEDSVLEQEVTA